MQDASIQESMGPIVDRTKENLVSTDNGIIMARHRLMKAAKALADKGVSTAGYQTRRAARALGAVILARTSRSASRRARRSSPSPARRTHRCETSGARHDHRIGAHEHGQGGRVRIQHSNSMPRAIKVIALAR